MCLWGARIGFIYLFGGIFKGNLMGNDMIIVELNPKCCFKDSGLQLNCTVPPRGAIKEFLGLVFSSMKGIYRVILEAYI